MKKIIGFATIIAVIALSSCLKNSNTNFALTPSGTPNTAQFATSTLGTWKAGVGFSTNSVVPSSVPTIINMYAELSSSDNSLTNSTMTITKTPTLVTDYNTAYSGAYQILPDSCYTLVSTTATTDANAKATFQIKVFSNKVDLTVPYALGLTLNSATGATVASNRNKLVFSVGVKNLYDGIYNLHGFILRATDPVLTGIVGPKEVSLKTIDANSVVMVENHGWANNSGSGLAATVQPSYTINPATFAVSSFSTGGAFPGGIMVLPGYNAHYDPATKIIYCASTWGGGPGVREMYDTLEYLRPRP